jgi:PAS domain-containing protein
MAATFFVDNFSVEPKRSRTAAAIVASSGDAIISTGLDGIIATWNNGAEAIFGYRPEEVIGRPVSVLAAPGREDEMPLMLDGASAAAAGLRTLGRQPAGQTSGRHFQTPDLAGSAST